MADAAPVSKEHRFPCEQCGADYRFDPDAALLICDHCGHSEEIAQAGPWESSIRELDFQSAVSGQLDRVERNVSFTAFELRATLDVPAGVDPVRGEKLMEKAKANCFVTNSLKGAVELVAEVTVAA